MSDSTIGKVCTYNKILIKSNHEVLSQTNNQRTCICCYISRRRLTRTELLSLPWRSFSFSGSELYTLNPFSMPQAKQPATNSPATIYFTIQKNDHIQVTRRKQIVYNINHIYYRSISLPLLSPIIQWSETQVSSHCYINTAVLKSKYKLVLY